MTDNDKNGVLNKFKDSYGQKITEHSCHLPFADEEIYFKPIRTIEQKSMVKAFESEKMDVINKCFDDVLSEIVTDWGEIGGCDDLYLQDRRHLLMMARSVSKGNIIKFTPTCPLKKCQEKGDEIKVNILELKTLNLPEDLKSRRISLEAEGWELDLSPAKRKDEKKLDTYRTKNRRQFSQSMTEEGFASETLMIDCLIENGEKNVLGFEDKMQIFNQLLGKDKEKIDSYIDQISEYGMQSSIDHKCPICGYKSEVGIDSSDFLLR